MPTLHLLHGLPGSGKTTFARKLERELKALRLTPDEIMVALHGTNPPEEIFRPAAAKIMALIWVQAEQTLLAGGDVIMDVGFWSRTSRNEARERAMVIGVPYQFYVLPCSLAEARRRVLERTALMPPGALEITEPTFEFLARQMEPMGADEEHIVVEPGSGRDS